MSIKLGGYCEECNSWKIKETKRCYLCRLKHRNYALEALWEEF